MELELTRVEYLQVGITSGRTLRLLPGAGGKAQQRVVVGDDDGVVQVFFLKEGEPNFVFRTLPGQKINRTELGGALGTVRDKIFVATGSEIKGFTKKGKMFLQFETNLAESIQSMYISGSNLMVCGNYVYNHYNDCRDTNYLLAGDRVTDVISLPVEKVKTLIPIIACADRSLKVIKDSEVMYTAELPGPPTTMQLFYNDGGESGEQVLYGTEDGKIGMMTLGKSGPDAGWVMENDGVYAGVQCLDNFDITGDGVRDLIVARHDGNIEVYSYDDGEDAEPTLKMTHNCSESVTSIEGGVVSHQGYEEIVASTYTGKIFGLSSVPTGSASAGAKKVTSETHMRMAKLRAEIDELQQMVNKERERYQAQAVSTIGGMSAIPKININDKMTLNQTDASYILSMECQTAIDNILLHSDVPVDLLDIEKNSAVVSYSACKPEEGNFLLATYRCQANTTRIEIKIRTIEGQYGTLTAYVTPRIQPKCCQVQTYKVRPLSLHMRSHHLERKRPQNVLSLSGQFTISEIHSWISFCLPEVSEKVPAGDSASISFISTFLDTVLTCTYSKGSGVFKSDNISTISILKDFLTKEATKKKIQLDISCEVNDESVIDTLNLIHPKLESQLLLAKQVALVEPIKDLAAHEPDTSFLSPEYKYILENCSQLDTQFRRQPARLERLYGMITDLYIDHNKFKGNNVKNKVPQLLEILDKYELEALLDFFKADNGS